MKRGHDLEIIAWFCAKYRDDAKSGRGADSPPSEFGLRSWPELYRSLLPDLGNGRTLKTFIRSFYPKRRGFTDRILGIAKPQDRDKGWENTRHLHDLSRNQAWQEVQRSIPKFAEAHVVTVTPTQGVGGGKRAKQATIAEKPISHRLEPASTPESQEDIEDEQELDDLRREVKVREKQSLFRKRVMKNFGGKCCLTGIAEPDLLIAGHVVPWHVDEYRHARLKTANGVLFSALWDRLFEEGYITFTNDLVVEVTSHTDGLSRDLKMMLHDIRGKHAFRPKRAIDPKYLAYHRNHIFEKNARRD